MFFVKTTSHITLKYPFYYQPTLTILRFLVQTTSLWRTCSFIDWPWERIVFSTKTSIAMKSVPCMLDNYLPCFRCEWVKSVTIMFKHKLLCFICVKNAWRTIYHRVNANINERDVQRKNVVNNVDESSFLTPWQNGPYKNTQNITKKRSIQKRNRHKEITIFLCFSVFLLLFFSMFNYLKDFSRTRWITALVRSMKNIAGLNQFSAAANLTLSHHFLEKKKKKIVHSFFSTRPLGN